MNHSRAYPVTSMEKYHLRLYVAGDTDLARRAVANLRRILETLPEGCCEVTVLDVLEVSHQARQDRVLATPVAIRFHPPPTLKVIGDLSDPQKVLDGLGLPWASGGTDH